MLLATPPFAPSVVRALNALGMLTRGDLRRTGAVQAFLLLKAAGCTVTRSVLWQLAAECAGTDARALTEEDKAALLDAVKRHPPVALPPAEAEAERLKEEKAKAAAEKKAAEDAKQAELDAKAAEVAARHKEA